MPQYMVYSCPNSDSFQKDGLCKFTFHYFKISLSFNHWKRETKQRHLAPTCFVWNCLWYSEMLWNKEHLINKSYICVFILVLCCKHSCLIISVWHLPPFPRASHILMQNRFNSSNVILNWFPVHPLDVRTLGGSVVSGAKRQICASMSSPEDSDVKVPILP